MFVCVCNAITDRQIRQAAANGVEDFDALRDQLGVASCCGRCEECAREVLDQATRLTAA